MASPKLVRNAAKVLSCLKELPDGQLITTVDCKIQIPARFNEKDLAQVGVDNYIYGIYALILEDGTYCVSNMNAMVKIDPYKFLQVMIDGVPYYEFHFKANSTVITNVNVVRRDTLMYNVLDEFIFQGNIPWYFNYEDLGKLFDTAKSYANSNVAGNLEVIELIASMIARRPNDRTKYYRTGVESYAQIEHSPPDYVALKSVFYSATNTLNKLAGSYFSDGVVSALVNPTHSVERIEQLLRA